MRFEEEHIFGLILAVIIGGIIFIVADIVNAKGQPHEGVIVDLSFSQGHTSTTNGVVLNSKGGVSPVVGTTSTPDEWIAMVKMSDGAVVKVDCKPEHYYGHKLGDNIKFASFYGRWTGIHWANQSIK